MVRSRRLLYGAVPALVVAGSLRAASPPPRPGAPAEVEPAISKMTCAAHSPEARPGATVWIQVFDREKNPLGDAEVILTPLGGKAKSRSLSTKSDGTILLPVLAGDFQLQVHHEGFITASQEFNVQPSYDCTVRAFLYPARPLARAGRQ